MGQSLSLREYFENDPEGIFFFILGHFLVFFVSLLLFIYTVQRYRAVSIENKGPGARALLLMGFATLANGITGYLMQIFRYWWPTYPISTLFCFGMLAFITTFFLQFRRLEIREDLFFMNNENKRRAKLLHDTLERQRQEEEKK